MLWPTCSQCHYFLRKMSYRKSLWRICMIKYKNVWFNLNLFYVKKIYSESSMTENNEIGRYPSLEGENRQVKPGLQCFSTSWKCRHRTALNLPLPAQQPKILTKVSSSERMRRPDSNLHSNNSSQVIILGVLWLFLTFHLAGLLVILFSLLINDFSSYLCE